MSQNLLIRIVSTIKMLRDIKDIIIETTETQILEIIVMVLKIPLMDLKISKIETPEVTDLARKTLLMMVPMTIKTPEVTGIAGKTLGLTHGRECTGVTKQKNQS
jgi:hypothetical protein